MIRASLNWIFLIVGTVIGAGYASGRELWQFYGHGSSMAILLFVLLFSICCYSVMTISYNNKSTAYADILPEIAGKKLTNIYDIIIFFYLLATTVVMVAGSGATGEVFSFSFWWGIVIIVISILLTFSFKVEGFLLLNKQLIPILIFGLLYTILAYTFNEKVPLLYDVVDQHNWMASIPFTSLNILSLFAVIGAVGHKIKTKGEIWISSIASGLILGTITYTYNNSLVFVSDRINDYEIPLFIFLENFGMKWILFMTVCFWLAMFTSAAANILGMTTRLQKFVQLPFIAIVLLILVTVVPLSTIGFTTLIRYLYPAYAVLNLYVLVKLVLYPVLNRK